MKLTTSFFILMTTLFSSLAPAGINGSSGDSISHWVTVEVCDRGEGACQTINYKVQPPTETMMNEADQCFITRGDMEVPCPTNFHVPLWLRNDN